MQPQNQINPDVIIQQALQAKLNLYSAKEALDAVQKAYNDNVDNLIGTINLMKARIMELEARLKEREADKEQGKLKKS